MLETLGAVLGVTLAMLALMGALWRWVVLPNLREQLLKPVEETRVQVTENRHRHRPPTVRDQLDDVETTLKDIANHVDLVALNLLAVSKQIGTHIGESEQDRARLWLMVESLVHEQGKRKRTERKQRDARSDQGGT